MSPASSQSQWERAGARPPVADPHCLVSLAGEVWDLKAQWRVASSVRPAHAQGPRSWAVARLRCPGESSQVTSGGTTVAAPPSCGDPGSTGPRGSGQPGSSAPPGRARGTRPARSLPGPARPGVSARPRPSPPAAPEPQSEPPRCRSRAPQFPGAREARLLLVPAPGPRSRPAARGGGGGGGRERRERGRPAPPGSRGM